MANHVYPKTNTAFEKKLINLSTDSLKIVLLNSSYVYSAAHAFLSDIPAGDRIATAALASVTVGVVGEGVLDAADVTLPSIASGSTIVSYVIYDDTPATEAGKFLICYVDTDSNTNPINVVTNGSDVTVTFDPAGVVSILSA